VNTLHGGFAVDGAHIGAGLGRPDDGDPFRRWWFGHLLQAELAQDVFVRDAFSASQRSASAVKRGSRLRRNLFLFHRRGSERMRQRAGHHLEQVNDGGELTSVELIEELVCFLFLVRRCHQE
jgi:hypothetical protein